LAIVLAGGEGKRLMPLTRDRAKPAVPFGGIYRLVDFALSNVVNSGYLKVVVLTQYKSHSLDKHVTKTWRMSTMLGNYVAPVPAQQRVDKNWYLGSADAIFQSLNLIDDERPEIVVVVGADHVYRMDFSQMVEQHIETGAGLTVAAIRQPIHLADQFGVIEVDDDDPMKIAAFREKPTDPKGLPDSPHEVLASMGNYVFTTDASWSRRSPKTTTPRAASTTWAATSCRASSAGSDAYVYDFKDNDVPGATERDRGYWRDVGTLDSYYDAHMDLISVHPIFNLYNYDWMIYTNAPAYPPAKFVHGSHDRVGEALSSAVSPGVVVSGAQVNHSVLSPRVRCTATRRSPTACCSTASRSSRYAVIRRAIIDKGVFVPEYAGSGSTTSTTGRVASTSPRRDHRHRQGPEGPAVTQADGIAATAYPVSSGDPRPRGSPFRSLRNTPRMPCSATPCVALEELGVDLVLTWDHFFPLSGDPDGIALRVRGACSPAWAEATERVELGPAGGVHGLSQPRPACRHRPDRRPHQRRSGDLRDRRGWFERDFTSTTASNSARPEADWTHWPLICRAFGPAGTIWCLLPRAMPILVGGGGERKTLRITAEHADIWHGFGDPELIAHKHQVLDAWCARIGRDPLEIERSAGWPITPARLPERSDLDFAGQAQALFDVGTRLLTLSLTTPPYDLGPVREVLAWRDEVNAGGSTLSG
jgi:glucose-1-phosphate adenylyltransferase